MPKRNEIKLIPHFQIWTALKCVFALHVLWCGGRVRVSRFLKKHRWSFFLLLRHVFSRHFPNLLFFSEKGKRLLLWHANHYTGVCKRHASPSSCFSAEVMLANESFFSNRLFWMIQSNRFTKRFRYRCKTRSGSNIVELLLIISVFIIEKLMLRWFFYIYFGHTNSQYICKFPDFVWLCFRIKLL